MTYMKNVNGVDVPCTTEECAEIAAREVAWEAGRAAREAKQDVIRIENSDETIPPPYRIRVNREIMIKLLSLSRDNDDLLARLISIEDQISDLRTQIG